MDKLYTFLLICVLGWLTPALAQPTTCLDFAGLPVNGLYQEIDVPFYSEDNVTVSLDTFFYLNGNSGFLQAQSGDQFVDGINWPHEGVHFFVSNVQLNFNFSQYANPPHVICLNYVDLGGQVNLRINGQTQVFEDFPSGGWQFAPGIFVDEGNSTLCINSEFPIYEFAVGGQEFLVDNVCFQASELGDCVSLDNFDPRFTEAANAGFPHNMVHYAENNVTFALFREVNLAGFNPNGTVSQLAAVNVPGFTAASGQVFSYTQSLARIDLSGLTSPGQGISLDYFLPFNTPSPLAHYLAINGVSLSGINLQATGHYSYGNFRITVAIPAGSVQTGTLTITPSTPNARIETLLLGGTALVIDNLCTSTCPLSALYVAPAPCTANFAHVVNLNYAGSLNTTTPVSVFLNGNLVQQQNTPGIPAGSFPREFIIPHDFGPGDTIFWAMTLADDTTCRVETAYIIPSCDLDLCDTLQLLSLTAEPYEQFPGQLLLTFTLGGQGIGQGIQVTNQANGATTVAGPWWPGQPLSALITAEQGVSVSFFTFRDPVSGCEFEFGVDHEPVLPCVIVDLTYTIDCLPNGNYYVDLDFSGSSFNSLYQVSTANGQTFGPFTIDQLPFRVGPFEPTNANLSLTVFDVELGCVASVVVEQTCQPTCQLPDLTMVSPAQCSGNTYVATLSFSQTSPQPPSGAQVQIRSTRTGHVVTLPYQPTLTIQFPSPNTPNGERLEICLGNLPDCCQIVEFPVDCGHNCELTDPNFNFICQPDGTYALSVYFVATEPGNAFFDLFVNNDFIGFYPLNELPLTIHDLTFPDNAASAVVRVCVNDQPNCCLQETAPLPVCPPPGDCNFQNLVVEPHACDGDNFLVDVAFQNPHPSAQGFYIFADGVIYGPFAYGQAFYTVGPLQGNDPSHNLLLIDLANPACYAAYDFNYLCTDDCVILQATATALPCHNDGEYMVQLDLETLNPGSSFLVAGNGQVYGLYNYADLPVTLGPFVGDGLTTYQLGIIDLQNPACTATATVGPVNCAPCTLSNLTYTVACGPNDVAITLNFAYLNPASDHFALYFGNHLFEWYDYAHLPLTITLPYNSDFLYQNTLRVEDLEDESCGQTVDFDLPCCRLNWPNTGVRASDCADDGTFQIWVAGSNTPNYGLNLGDSLVITYAPAGSTLIETITVAYADLPTALGPLSGNGLSSYFVTLTDQEGGCSQAFTVAPVSCDNAGCVEFTALNGIYGPATGYQPGDTIHLENSVAVSYLQHPFANCVCNVFGLPNTTLPGISFGDGQIVSLQGSGLGLDLRQAPAFTSFSIEYYTTGGSLSLVVNGGDTLTVSHPSQWPTTVAPGVSLSVSTGPGANAATGLLTFTGPVQTLALYSTATSAWDNLCFTHTVANEEVWPGDANSDNLAGHFDLLNVGLAYAFQGPARSNANNANWDAQPAAPWSGAFADGLNFKHADCNGDGQVDVLDREVILQNYNLTHGVPEPYLALPSTDLDPPVFLGTSQIGGNLPSGVVFQIPIEVGTSQLPVDDIYGLAFTLQLDPEVFDLSSLELVYPTSWLGEPGVNLIQLDYRYNSAGKLEVALVRTDHNNVSGFGPVAFLRGIIDDIVGIHTTVLDIQDLNAINARGERIPLNPVGLTLNLTHTQQPLDGKLLESSFRVFPNPTNGMLYFSNLYDLPAERLELYDAAGRLVWDQRGSFREVSLENLPTGVYLLQIQSGGYRFNRRIVRIEP